MTIQAQDVKGLEQKIIVYCFYYCRKTVQQFLMPTPP